MKIFISPKSSACKSLGAVAAEFALGFPLLILLIMMLVDSGLYLFQRALLTDSTARLNRDIVTQLGQLEAEASFFGTNAKDCDDLKSTAIYLKNKIITEKEILYRGMTFRLKVKTTPSIPFRLITTGGANTFKCLTCKFFPVDLNIQHTSVLVVERPPHAALLCTDMNWVSLS